MAKILLADDDKDLTSAVVHAFISEKHTVDVVHRGDDALMLLSTSIYDAIILDITMPGVTGLDVLREFREKNGQTPVIILTGRDHVNDKELGLDLGADDYLTKPFSVRELLARIRAVLRRPTIVKSNQLVVKDIVLDQLNLTITKGGKEIRLQPRDFALLEFFMRHPNQVFSIDTLLDRVWNFDAMPTADGLRTAISRIRKALDEENVERSIIENLPKLGYRLKD